MKKSELNFKVIVTTRKRVNTIITMLIAAKLNGDVACPSSDQNVICVEKGNVFSNHDLRYIDTLGVQHLPEVTYHHALDLIAQVETEPESGSDAYAEGEFVDLDIDEKGRFRIGEGTAAYLWSTIEAVGEHYADKYVFAGWLWKAPCGTEFYSLEKQGVAGGGGLSGCAEAWARPVRPIAIRFWKIAQ